MATRFSTEPLSIADHQTVGTCLRQVRNALQRLVVDLTKKKSVRHLYPAERAVEKLRCKLDSVYYANPDRILPSPYYGDAPIKLPRVTADNAVAYIGEWIEQPLKTVQGLIFERRDVHTGTLDLFMRLKTHAQLLPENVEEAIGRHPRPRSFSW